MFAFIQIFIAICPIVPLFYFATKVYRFCNVLNKRRCIREKHISFKGIKDFFPKRIRQELESDSSIVKRFIDEVLEAYQKLLFAFCVYILFWILYFTGIVVRIVWLFNNHYALLDPQEHGCVIGSVLMSILILYWFLLTPIFDFFHWKKLSNLGYITWKFLLDMLEIIVEWFKQIIKYICEIMVSFFPMYVYIILVNKILLSAQIKLTFWIDLLILMLYQYMLLKLFSNIIKWIIMFITKKIHKLQCFEKYVKGEIIYLIFKNCTYLSMVFVYAVAVGRDKSGMPLAAAIGVLFLVDTFFAQEKAIQEKIKKSNLEQ
ncbi:MAG: hypothetical protein SO160_03090 [Lachnospiraceae bacterium]|nr:hypothetical protein [Lachnospiraceae bacterium]